MCLDEGGMQWAKAWMGKTPPSAGVIGFGYMLRGSSDASNTDPMPKHRRRAPNRSTPGRM